LVDYLNGLQWKAGLLDAKNIEIKGYDKIEACDVISLNGIGDYYLFHNKYNSGSSALSHLFSQANVAAELLTKHEFRKRVNEKINILKIPELKFPEDEPYDPRKYIIVIGIITKKGKSEYSIPLFSKINMRIFIDRIKSKSYKVKLCFFEEN
jgi:uncharacterized protein (TIGR04141 family)